MARIAGLIVGYIFLVLGVIGMLTPIPFGIVFLVLSFLLLIPTSPGTTRAIRRMRHRSTRFDRMMSRVIRKMPHPYRRILRQTDIDFIDRIGA